MAIGNDKVIQIQLKLLDQISGNLSQTISAMKQAEKEAKDLSTTEKDLNGQNTALNGSFGAMGGKVLGVVGAYVGLNAVLNKTEQAISFIVATGSDFQQSLANTRAILQPTAQDFSALSQEAFDLGKTTVFTAAQAGDAFTELGKLGFNTSQILSAGNDVLSLAAATQVDMARAATVSATVLNQFNLEAGRTGEVVDTIAKAMNISALDIDGFALSMKYVGPIAKQSGESIQATSAALGVLADNGLQSMTAGTGMRRILTMLADSGSKASKAIASINPNAKTFADKLEVLHKLGMDTSMAVDFFGIEAQNAANILSNNVPKLRKYGDALEWVDGKAKGYAQTVADIQIDTFQGDVKLLTSAVEALGIQFFEAFGPQLREGVSLLNEEVAKLTQWAEENPDKLEKWGNAALGIFDAVLGAANKLAAGIEIVGDALSAISPEKVDFDPAAEFRDATIQMQRLAEQTRVYAGTVEDVKRANGDDGMAAQAAENYINSKRAFDLQKIAAEESLAALIKERNNLSTMIGMKVEISKEDQKRFVMLQKNIPIMEYALQKEISFDEARRRMAQKRVNELKAAGNAAKVNAKGGAAPDMVSGSLSSEETEKAGKAANESWERLLREREKIGKDAETRAILDRQNYWEDLIAIDMKGKSQHLEQLKQWRDEEISLMLSGLPDQEYSNQGNVGLGGRSGGYSGPGGPQMGPGLDEDRKKRLEEALAVQNELMSSQYDLERQREEARYRERKELLDEFHMDTEALTAEHEARMSEISRTEWEARGVVVAGFFGSMSQLMEAAAGKNKAMAQAAKHLAVLEVIMNTAVAVSKVWSQTGIFGTMAIAAPIMSGAAQIATIESLHFAMGGIVPGSSYYGDNVEARVNSGEMVLTRGQQARLFDMANGRSTSNDYSSSRVYNITYAPQYTNDVPEYRKAQDQLNFARTLRSVETDPSSSRVQARLA